MQTSTEIPCLGFLGFRSHPKDAAAYTCAFQQLDIKVNPSIIFGLRGRSGRQWLKKHVFLGVAVSYGQFEVQKLKHGMKVARQKHWRVKRLHSTRAQNLKYRLRLYLTCIRSTTMYGLHAVGFTRKKSLEAGHV